MPVSAPISNSSVKSNVKAEVNTTNTKAQVPTTITQTVFGGDSMYKVARRAVKAYSEEKGYKLDNIQKTFAENKLVEIYGSRDLNIGEQVTFEKSVIEQVISQSQKLSQSERSSWAYFANQISFDY